MNFDNFDKEFKSTKRLMGGAIIATIFLNLLWIGAVITGGYFLIRWLITLF